MDLAMSPGKHFVLVVDPNGHRGRALASELRSVGCYASVAGSGEEALGYSIENEPDAILSDWNLPDVPALDLARRLKALSSRTKILFQKNEADWRLLRQVLECGGDDLLCRPFSIGQLIRILNRMLRRTSRTDRVLQPSP